MSFDELDLKRLSWSPGDISIGDTAQKIITFTAGDLADLQKRGGWKGAYLHELRGPNGEWIKDSDKLISAATGRRAGSVRTHDHVLYAKVEPTADRYGLQSRFVPMEATQIRHHWEGTGKKRKRFTDMTLHDPETGENISESVKDGSPVKIYPREDVRGLHLPKPKPDPSPGITMVNGKPFNWAEHNKPRPKPAPEAPAVKPGETLYHGSREHEFKPGDIIDAQHSRGGVTDLQEGKQYAFASTDPGEASFFAGHGHVYRVEPVGSYEVDPHMHNATSRRSTQGFRVIEEVQPWSGKPVAKPATPHAPKPKPPEEPPVSHAAPAEPAPKPAEDFSNLNPLMSSRGKKQHISTASGTISSPAIQAAAEAEVQHGLDLQSKFVPKIAGRQKVTITDDLHVDDGRVANGQVVNGDAILINPYNARAVGNGTRAMKGLTPDQLQRKEQENGWWVPSDPEYSLMDTTLAHEEGHVIADKLSNAALFNADLWNSVAKAAEVSPPPTFRDISKKVMPDVRSWLTENEDGLKKAVSVYSTSDVQELQAELWSEYTMNAHPRPPAQIYGDYVTAQLKAVGNL